MQFLDDQRAYEREAVQKFFLRTVVTKYTSSRSFLKSKYFMFVFTHNIFFGLSLDRLQGGMTLKNPLSPITCGGGVERP